MKKDVYQIVTDRIIELLEAGVVPWRKTWATFGGTAPKNFVSGKEYRGINVWLLGAAGFGSPYWLSFKQAKDLGGSVRKGEKGSIAVFWKWLEVVDKNDREKMKRIPLLRYYTVFNVEQCEGIEYPKPEAVIDFKPIDGAEWLVSSMPKAPAITHGGDRAFYRRSTDTVTMPLRNCFEATPAYYSTLFHELAHSTGHESRLNRSTLTDAATFGDEAYAKEELVAEMSASYLCALCGIENTVIENAAAYIADWLKSLKNDRKLVVHAATAAQKATDFILGKTFEPAEPAADEAAAGVPA